MSGLSLLVTTPKLYRMAVEEYGVQVANLMWDYCQLIRKQCEISGSSPRERRRRQRKACMTILNDVVMYGDPRADNDVVIGGSDGCLTRQEIEKEME